MSRDSVRGCGFVLWHQRKLSQHPSTKCLGEGELTALPRAWRAPGWVRGSHDGVEAKGRSSGMLGRGAQGRQLCGATHTHPELLLLPHGTACGIKHALFTWDYINDRQFITDLCNIKKQAVCPAFALLLVIGSSGKKLQPWYRQR